MSEALTFLSLLHPDDRSRAFVFSNRLVRPLSACMLPVMIGALVSMLQGMPALMYLYAGFPLAILISGIWTYIRMQDVVVEIHFRNEEIGIRSLLDATNPRGRIHWYRLLDLHLDGLSTVRMTLGRESFLLRMVDWPAAAEIIAHLQDLFPTDRVRHLPGNQVANDAQDR